MARTTLHLSKAELIAHRGSVFSVWRESWESSHPEDASEEARFAFSEAVSREEFLRLKSRMGTDPDYVRESLALFRISIDPIWVLDLPADDGQIDGSYLHPVAVFRRNSAFSKLVRSELLETAGGALGTLWSQLTKDIPQEPARDEAQEIGVIIEAWAESHDLPLQGQVDSAKRLILLVLNGEEIPGEMDIVGKIAIVIVRDHPASYAVETADGRWILDESWADASSLPSVLDNALRVLRLRVKSPLAQWALAFAAP